MNKGSQSESKIVVALRRLIEDGWLPLRQVGTLLGYSHATGVYGRQHGPNAIPTVKVGGTLRVYTEDVLHTLENVKEADRDIAVAILSKYRLLLKEYNNE